MERFHLAVVTGLSGAGRSTALKGLEDLGFFCVDNIPPALAPQLVDLLSGDPGAPTRIGLGVDVRTGKFLEGATAVLDTLEAQGHKVEVIFLECTDETLVRRFSETRRSHPLAPGGDIMEAIRLERERLGPLRARAEQIIDTGSLTVHDLRRAMIARVSSGEARPHMVTRVMSFGFKYGVPVDADLVFDLRFLPNPHFVPELKPLTGLDAPVAKFVLELREAQELVEDLTALMRKLLPRYEREGKAYLSIALGCTGGRHRSVALTEELGRLLDGERTVVVEHRDVDRKV